MDYFEECERDGDSTIYRHITTGKKVKLSGLALQVIPEEDLEDELFYQLAKLFT